MSTEASNALVSVVRFYSDALARETLARQQVEATLRQVLSHPPDREDPQRARLIDAALKVDRLPHVPEYIEAFHEAASAYRVSRNEVDRVEPAPERDGPLRGAPADGEPDLPRPAR